VTVPLYVWRDGCGLARVFARRLPRLRQEPHRLVFIDETAVKTNLTRLRGRGLKGERLYGTAPFGKWGTQTFIAGLTQDALIAPWVITGAMDGLAFDTYIETQLAPALEPGTVVILDNLSTHKSPRAARALKDRGCWFLFLPPYSSRETPFKSMKGRNRISTNNAKCGVEPTL
jgi:transposase